MRLLRSKAFINGAWVCGKKGKSFEVLNPATNTVVGHAAQLTVPDVESAITAASNSFQHWWRTPGKERGAVLKKWHSVLEAHTNDLAEIISAESGKTLAEAQGEVKYANSFVEWFAEESRRIAGEVVDSSVRGREMVFLRQPIGVVGLITPWNFPIAMITRKAAAALAAGCTCIVKPAEDTPLTALALAELSLQADMPPGLFNVVTCDRAEAPAVGKLLCQNPQVAGISFTGSTEVGRILYEQCGKGIKRLSLELGGNAPFIVFKSADLNKAVNGAIASKFRNCGQTCVSANRFFIQQDVYDQFIQKLTTEVDKLTPGSNLGPLINKPQMDKVSGLVNDAISRGAKVIRGGTELPKLGPLYFSPTILTNISQEMRLYSEEVFGPVVTIIPFTTEEEVIQLANNCNRGLAGYFFTNDLNQAWRVARELEVGMIGINEGIISTAEAAFGGIKESGFGREGSHHGLDEFTYIKYLCFGNIN